jgi:hypothetical protein
MCPWGCLFNRNVVPSQFEGASLADVHDSTGSANESYQASLRAARRPAYPLRNTRVLSIQTLTAALC